MLTYNTWLVLLGAGMLGALCGVVGCFAVLRRRALLGDALAHASLPGIALIFWITQRKEVPVLLVGALASGLAGVAVLAWIKRHARTREDAALGIVLSVFFGAGIALSRFVQNQVPDGSTAGLDTFLLGKTAGIVRQDVELLAWLSGITLIVIYFLYKELRLVSFDLAFAKSLGWNTTLLDFWLMAMLALAVVVGLPMVGVILVAALTILPAVAARFWTDNLSRMLVIAGGFGAFSALVGGLMSASFSKMPTGPLMILCAGGLFLISAAFAPTRGVIAQGLNQSRQRLHHGVNLALREFETQPRLAAQDANSFLRGAGILKGGRVLSYALRKKWLERQDNDLVLTPLGLQQVKLREGQ